MGSLGYFLLLHYFRNNEIKNTGLIHCFWSLQAILTGLIPVRTYIKLDPKRLEYDPFSDRWDQIRMYLSKLRIYTIELPSLDHISLYHRFASWCLRKERNSHNTIYVP